MSMLLDQRDDGSLAFFLDGDLQFDSVDERIYHESLALPALGIVTSRGKDSLQALIIGGGDGLTARELLKSAAVTSIDLVDYDGEVIELARTEFSRYNDNSLADPRVTVTVEDARDFVGRAVAAGTKYDVIISDLTASHDADAAQLHTIEFYGALHKLLSDDGALAVNCASPTGTPAAYWSIFNSILASSLNPRPYRISLPSFAQQGYGVDWGFILASPKLITGDEIDKITLAEPRHELKDVQQMRGMFSMPQEVFERQKVSCAGCGDSDILVNYLFSGEPIDCANSALVDTLSIDLTGLTAPQQSGSYLLPQELHQALSVWRDDPTQKEAVMEEVFELMPALRRLQTREMIADFLDKPATFNPINLQSLVNALLSRATELPEKLVQELTLLKDKIVEFAGDHERLFSLGLRSLAVIAVVVIIGNLMYPDAAYAKGQASHASHAGHAGGHEGHGRGRVGVGGAGWNNGGGTVINNGTGHWGPWFTNASGKRTRNWIR